MERGSSKEEAGESSGEEVLGNLKTRTEGEACNEADSRSNQGPAIIKKRIDEKRGVSVRASARVRARACKTTLIGANAAPAQAFAPAPLPSAASPSPQHPRPADAALIRLGDAPGQEGRWEGGRGHPPGGDGGGG